MSLLPRLKPRMVATLTAVNWLCLILGLAIVWLVSHNWVAVLGAWVASIHVTVRVEKSKP